MTAKSALVAGATGLVGRSCVQAVLADPAWDCVIVLTRRPLPPSDSAPRLVQLVADFEQLEKLDLPPVDVVFCALGTTIRKAGSQQAFRRVDFELPLAVARLGLKAGASQFVLVSSVGADARSKNFYLRTKGEVEEAVSALPFSAVHIFRPSLLLGKREERRAGEAAGIIAGRALQFAMIGPLRRYHPVDAQEVARAMVAAAARGTDGRFFYEYKDIIELA